VIDAGHCEVVSAGLDGVIHADSDPTLPTPSTYASLLTALADRCRKLMAKPGVTTFGIGVSFPGLTDARTGRGVLSPNVPVTNGHTPAADLGDQLGLTAVALQESHALCLAERHHGLAVGLDDFAMLDVSTGVGLGVMSGGRLLAGHGGMAGEIGHVTAVADGGRACGCGNTGCLETVASDSALAWRVSRRLGRELSVDDVVELARSDRGRIVQELQVTARYVGIAVAAVVNLFNPATVFVHSLLFEADPGLFDRIVEEARGRALPPSWADCRVVRAKGNKRQGAVAGIVQHLTNEVAPGLSHV
jgi:N-acetylglucosamine repressor